jgi:hypothetical protein
MELIKNFEAITRYLEEYQQVPIAIQEDDKDNIRLRVRGHNHILISNFP